MQTRKDINPKEDRRAELLRNHDNNIPKPHVQFGPLPNQNAAQVPAPPPAPEEENLVPIQLGQYRESFSRFYNTDPTLGLKSDNPVDAERFINSIVDPKEKARWRWIPAVVNNCMNIAHHPDGVKVTPGFIDMATSFCQSNLFSPEMSLAIFSICVRATNGFENSIKKNFEVFDKRKSPKERAELFLKKAAEIDPAHREEIEKILKDFN